VATKNVYSDSIMFNSLFIWSFLPFVFLFLLAISCTDVIVKLQLPEDPDDLPRSPLLPVLIRLSQTEPLSKLFRIVAWIEIAVLIWFAFKADWDIAQTGLTWNLGIVGSALVSLLIAFHMATGGLWIFVVSWMLAIQFTTLTTGNPESIADSSEALLLAWPLWLGVIYTLQDRSAKTKTGLVRDWMIWLQMFVLLRQLPEIVLKGDIWSNMSSACETDFNPWTHPLRVSLLMLIPCLFAPESGREPRPVQWYPDECESQMGQIAATTESQKPT
jgi:hypothetical protein